MAGALNVQTVDIMAESVWDYRDSRPFWRHGRYGLGAHCDPFPAYPHDLTVVEQTAAAVAQRVPPLWTVDLVLADREDVGRTNGFSGVRHDGHYEGEDERRWVQDPPTGLIFLAGKRTPIHPAVTRYLVGHEYGHHVEWMLNWVRGGPKALQGDLVVTEYAKLRGLPASSVHHGSGGRWHDSVTEVFANDFRVIVCGVELDFWPHPDVPAPWDRPHQTVWDWWDAAVEELAKAGPVVADHAA